MLLVFLLEGTCNACDEGFTLIAAADAADTCDCSGPNEMDLLQALGDGYMQMYAEEMSRPVVGFLEATQAVIQDDCIDQNVTDFRSNVAVSVGESFLQTATEEQLLEIASLFEESYNQANGITSDYCDPLNREVGFVTFFGHVPSFDNATDPTAARRRFYEQPYRSW
jgi:hypothetical protein